MKSQQARRTSLILYSFSERSVVDADSLKLALRARVPFPVNFHVEYLESRSFDKKGYEKHVVDTLGDTLSGLKLDLVIADLYPALQFAVTHRDKLFPGVPIVFLEVDMMTVRWRICSCLHRQPLVPVAFG